MSSKAKIEPQRIFLESPYDLETLFESLSIASTHDKELLYMDRLVALLRLDPTADLTTLNYKILRDLKILELENIIQS
jgi:hypothetical protein